MRKNLPGILTFILCILILQTNLFAQGDIKKAWTLFHENKYTESLKLAEEIASKDGPEKADATMLCYFNYDVRSDFKNGIKCLERIVKITDDYNSIVYGFIASNIVKNCPCYSDGDLIKIFKDLAESNRLDGTAAALVNEFLYKRFDTKWKTDKAAKYSKSIGAIGDWQAVGVFENISESGFDKNFAPITQPDSNSIFTSKYGSELKWFKIIKPKTNPWINLKDYFVYENSIIYLQDFCTSPEDKDVQFRLGSKGSIRLWVNDVEILTSDEERNTCPDAFVVPAKLKKGVNRILVQIGIGAESEPALVLRITNSKGEPISDLKYSSDYSTYHKSVDKKSNFFLRDIEQNFIKLSEQNKNTYSYTYDFLLSNYYFLNDKSFENRRLLGNLNQKEKKSGYILSAIVELNDNLENAETLKIAKDNFTKNAPNHPKAIQIKLDEAFECKNLDDVPALLTLFEQNCACEELVYEVKLKYVKTTDKSLDINILSKESYKKYPYRSSFIFNKLYYSNVFVFSADIKELVTDYIREYKDLEFLSKMMRLVFSYGNNSKMIDLLEDLTADFPENLEYLSVLNITYSLKDKYEKSKEGLTRCVNAAPYKDSYQYYLGNVLLSMDKKDDALNLFRKCLAINPYNPQVLDRIRTMENKAGILTKLKAPKLDELYKASLSDSVPDHVNCQIIYDRTDKVVLTGGMYEEKSYLLVKALTQEGRDELKEKILTTFPDRSHNIEHAEVFKKDGSTIKADISNGQVVYTNLEIGDAVSIVISYKSLNYGNLAAYFCDSKSFAHPYPSKKIVYTLITPSNTVFDYKMSFSTVKPEIVPLDDYTVYSWVKTDVPAYKPEPLSSNYCDYAPTLHYSTIPNWGYVVQWYADIVRAKLKTNFEIHEVANELQKKNLKTDYDKAFAAYEYVVTNIRYSSVPFRQNGVIPQRTSNLIVSKMGDCKDVSTLFVSLCREMGLKANLALVCTRDKGMNALPMPSVEFNHVIGCVELDGKKVFVELTSDKIPFGTVMGMLKGALVLEVGDSSQAELITVDSDNFILNSKYRFSKVSFNNTDMNVDVNSIKTGGSAGGMRYVFSAINEEEKRKTLTTSLSSSFRNLKLGKFEFNSALNSLADSLLYHFEFKVPNAFSKIGGMYILQIPLIDNLNVGEVFAVETRKTGIDLTLLFESDLEEETIDIAIPEAMVLTEVPESKIIENQFGVYEISFNASESNLRIFRRFYLKRRDARKDMYKELREFINEIIKLDATQIGFK